jgi:hypothetical protein
MKTYYYTIIDLEDGYRGPHDLIFNCYKNSDRSFKKMLIDITRGNMELSYRKKIKINIEEIILKKVSLA